MLYFFTGGNHPKFNSEMLAMEIREITDPVFMSIIGSISLEESRKRLLNDNKAFVAFINDVPAAFGWMALGKAKIGELNREFILPIDEAYLWNFRTFENYRGMGIYTELLKFILRTEQQKINRFWIMHAPENKASERGIIKAGFQFAGPVSVIEDKLHFVRQNPNVNESEIVEIFEFDPSEEYAQCWNCSSPYLTKRKSECCCLSVSLECTHSLYA